MNELTPIQNMIFRAGALLLLAGLSMRLFMLPYSSIVATVGVLCFSTMQMLARYDGSYVPLLRLRRQQVFSDVLFLVMAGLMLMQDYGFGPSFVFENQNLWVLFLAIASLLQVYTAFRIPYEIEKEKHN